MHCRACNRFLTDSEIDNDGELCKSCLGYVKKDIRDYMKGKYPTAWKEHLKKLHQQELITNTLGEIEDEDFWEFLDDLEDIEDEEVEEREVLDFIDDETE